MTSQKTLYWIAVGVAAIFLGNTFVDGHGLTPCVRDRAIARVQRISSQAMRYAMLGQVIFGRGGAGFVQGRTATAAVQTRLAIVQTAMAHRESALARVQAERIRLLAKRRVVACPRQNLVINLPEGPMITAEGTL
jgi:ammonia channel protein AmtB